MRKQEKRAQTKTAEAEGDAIVTVMENHDAAREAVAA
jgi:hypothetical protein